MLRTPDTASEVFCSAWAAAAPQYSRKDLDGLTEYVGGMGAKGLVWVKVEPDTFTGPTAKFFSADVQQQLRALFGAKPGDLVLIVADTQAISSLALSSLRAKLAAELELYDPKSFHYSWIVRFPLFGWDADEKRFVAEHHPFTMPAIPKALCIFSIPSRPRCAPRPMTWLSTARNAAAGLSAFTTRPSSRRSSACWA